MPVKNIATFMLLILILVACAPQPTPTPSLTTPTSAIPFNPQTKLPTLNLSSCTIVSSGTSTPDPSQTSPASLFKPVSTLDLQTGAGEASITMLVYMDFQCESCAALHAVLEQLLSNLPQDIRLVYRYYPNPAHDKAMLSAQAAEAAGMQGKFWDFADLLFKYLADWTNLSSQDFEAYVQTQAQNLGLDLARFETDMHSDAVIAKLQSTLAEGQSIGIPALPFLLVDGEIYQGPTDLASLTSVAALKLLDQKKVVGCPPTVIDVNKQYLAHLNTTQGEIVIQLFADQTPITVNSFVFLAQRGWFNGIPFYRVISGFAAQTGDPSGTGLGSPGYAFQDEIRSGLNFDKAGMVGMANIASDFNGSLFFITLAPRPSLDGKYTVFGQVVQGMDVALKLTPQDPSQPGTLQPADKIITVTIEEK
jgi:cyclophilin family peptidyl-prolyl cis-trans isomerase/protein-disulfide isomerase